ncbi:MAG: ABC transporter ATP-binding protein [Holophagaceae bacterium]
MPEPILQVEQLTKRFGGFTAVEDLSFEVEPEEVFGFLGPNGAGKSTTIKMLCGVLAPTAGRARALGHDLFTEADAVRARIGYMSQKFSLLDDLTVTENLAYFGQLYGLSNAHLKDAIRQRVHELQLRPLGDVLVRGLSTGEKQRVALASATLHRPRMLFLDEPTSGVDPLRRRLFWEAMDDLVKDGMTILVTTHNLGEADQCDRLAFILAGRLMAYGKPRALKEGMGRQVVEVRAEGFRELRQAALNLPEVLDAELMGRGVRLSLDAETPAEAVLGRLRSMGLAFAPMAPELPSLEDLFISLVQASRKDG